MTHERKTDLMKYKAIVAVLKKWLSDGHISAVDYTKIEESMAVKYGISLCSIWRESP